MCEFPEKFLWGAAVPAFQAEGDYLTDGKSLSVSDVRLHKKAIEKYVADTEVAVDFYHRYR